MRIAPAIQTEGFQLIVQPSPGWERAKPLWLIPDPTSALKYCVLDIDRVDFRRPEGLPFSLVLLRHYCKSFNVRFVSLPDFSGGKALQSYNFFFKPPKFFEKNFEEIRTFPTTFALSPRRNAPRPDPHSADSLLAGFREVAPLRRSWKRVQR